MSRAFVHVPCIGAEMSKAGPDAAALFHTLRTPSVLFQLSFQLLRTVAQLGHRLQHRVASPCPRNSASKLRVGGRQKVMLAEMSMWARMYARIATTPRRNPSGTRPWRMLRLRQRTRKCFATM